MIIILMEVSKGNYESEVFSCTLKKAGLIVSKSRATYMTTNEGAKLLTTHPSIVNMKTLEHYDSYNWQTAGKQEENQMPNQVNNNCEAELTPDETIGKVYEELRSMFANDIFSEEE